MTPTKNLFGIVSAMLKDAWDQRAEQVKHDKATVKRVLAKLDQQQDALVERLFDTSNPRVFAELESNIARNEEDKLLLVDKAAQKANPKRNAGDIFELSTEFPSNPRNPYHHGSLAFKETVLGTAFQAPSAYD